MAVMNPCCCKLQLGVTIVALVNMAISLIALVWYFVSILIGVSVALAVVGDSNKYGTGRYEVHNGQLVEVKMESTPSSEEATIAVIGIFLLVITIIFVLSCLVSFIMSFILFLGARKKEISKCRVWLVVTIIFLIIYILFKIFNIGLALWVWDASNGGGNTSIVIVAITKEVLGAFFSLGIEGYQLWVVYAFMDELKTGESSPSFVPSEGIVHYVPKPGDNPPPYGGQSTSLNTYASAPAGSVRPSYPQS